MDYEKHFAGYSAMKGICPGQDTESLLKERLKQVRLFVLDMDGTIYLSSRLFDFTMPFLKKLEETGRSTQVIIEEMQQIHPEDTFYIVGTPSLVNAFRQAGLHVFGDHLPAASGSSSAALSREDASCLTGSDQDSGKRDNAAGSRPDVVILGFDTTLTYEKLARACKYLRHGADYYGVNMDYNCPVDDNGVVDYIPDCGSIAKLIERSTGRFPDFYGKPSRHALDFIIHHTGFREEEIAVVGDRIYTDIAIANGTKALSIMVLTGETQLSDLDQYDYRPDIILPSLAEITELL